MKRLTDEQSELAGENHRLAWFAARKLRRRYPHLDIDDLLSACYVGLCHAVSKHDPAKGTLGTYSLYWMCHYAQRESDSSRMITVPVRYARNQKGAAERNPEEYRDAGRVMGMARDEYEDVSDRGPDPCAAIDAAEEAEHILHWATAAEARALRMAAEGRCYAEIGADEGVSKQAIECRVKSGRNRIRRAVAS